MRFPAPRHGARQPARPWARVGGVLLALLVGVWVAMAAPGAAQMVIPADDEPFHVRLLGEREEPRPTRSGPVRVIGLDDRPGMRDEIEDSVFAARARLRETTRIDWEGTALIVWLDSERDFLARTGHRAEFAAAAASAAQRTVWINATAWNRAAPGTRQEIMTHELGHLLVGNLVTGERLPLWAEEGLVMHLAGEWNFTRTMAVARAHAFGYLPTLASLERSFPEDFEGRPLSYAVSYLAVAEIARSLGDTPPSVERLMRRLADPDAGPSYRDSLWVPENRDGWNSAFIERLGGRVTSAIVLLSSGTAFWVVIILLAMWAWRKKRARRREAAVRELEEEPWLESLSEGELKDIWSGDPDERWKNKGEDELPWEKWERLREEEEER